MPWGVAEGKSPASMLLRATRCCEGCQWKLQWTWPCCHQTIPEAESPQHTCLQAYTPNFAEICTSHSLEGNVQPMQSFFRPNPLSKIDPPPTEIPHLKQNLPQKIRIGIWVICASGSVALCAHHNLCMHYGVMLVVWRGIQEVVAGIAIRPDYRLLLHKPAQRHQARETLPKLSFLPVLAYPDTNTETWQSFVSCPSFRSQHLQLVLALSPSHDCLKRGLLLVAKNGEEASPCFLSLVACRGELDACHDHRLVAKSGPGHVEPFDIWVFCPCSRSFLGQLVPMPVMRPIAVLFLSPCFGGMHFRLLLGGNPYSPSSFRPPQWTPPKGQMVPLLFRACTGRSSLESHPGSSSSSW